VFDLELPPSFVPYNGDGEVESFQLMSLTDALHSLGREGRREGGREEGREGGRKKTLVWKPTVQWLQMPRAVLCKHLSLSLVSLSVTLRT